MISETKCHSFRGAGGGLPLPWRHPFLFALETTLCHWGCRTYTRVMYPLRGDVMQCANTCERIPLPISQKVLELGHALISQGRDPESLLKAVKAVELLSHSDHLLLR